MGGMNRRPPSESATIPEVAKRSSNNRSPNPHLHYDANRRTIQRQNKRDGYSSPTGQTACRFKQRKSEAGINDRPKESGGLRAVQTTNKEGQFQAQKGSS